MALNIDVKFEGKLTGAFKNDMHEWFSKFSQEHIWKSKNWDFDGILFLSKVENARA